MNRTFTNDYKFGLQNEDKILPLINKYFNTDSLNPIIKSVSSFSLNDFESDTTLYELKSRTNNYNKYNDTLLGFNKIINGSKKQVFLFNFTDGLFYIEYDETLFNTFTKKPFVRNQRTDYNDIPKIYLFIPINKLKKII